MRRAISAQLTGDKHMHKHVMMLTPGVTNLSPNTHCKASAMRCPASAVSALTMSLRPLEACRRTVCVRGCECVLKLLCMSVCMYVRMCVDWTRRINGTDVRVLRWFNLSQKDIRGVGLCYCVTKSMR